MSMSAIRVLAFIGVVGGGMAAPAGPAHSPEEAWETGWPALHGPSGNFIPLYTPTPLVEDLSLARLLWVSDEKDFGTSKTGSQTFKTVADIEKRLGPDAVLHPGNWAGLIMAGGRVFGSSFRPCGEMYSGEMKGPTPEKQGRFRFRLDAEDILIALDARTGKTLWKAVEAGGIILGGGKRGGFQVAPVYNGGRVFSMGSTGRIFAYEAATGKKIWQSDAGPAHARAAAERVRVLQAAATGHFTEPDGPEWFTSLVAADGVLVVPTWVGSHYARDIGLAGLDAATGARLWEVKDVCSRYATPALWRHDGRVYLLAATLSGKLHLIDPLVGKVLWTLEGLGPNYFSLGPSSTHVLVNVRPLSDPKEKRQPGGWGAVRLALDRGKIAWELPDEPAHQIPTWFDSCARQRAFINEGKVYLSTGGTSGVPGRFLLIDEETGKILASHTNEGPDENRIEGLFYLVNGLLLCRSDSAHGASHGGRHPWIAWSVKPGEIRRVESRGNPGSIDLVNFTTAYEVFMELPVVDGRMFERTADGRAACYDLRRPERALEWVLDLGGAYIGLPSLPLVMQTGADGEYFGAKVLPPDEAASGLVYGKSRRGATWQSVVRTEIRAYPDRFAGTLELHFGTHQCPVGIDVRCVGKEGKVEGVWKRSIPGIKEPVVTRGAVGGLAASTLRVFPTGWLPRQPWTPLGKNADGTVTWVLQLADALVMPAGSKPAGLTICLDHDGKRFVRAAAAAFGFNQAWHEVDASGLKLAGGGIRGEARVVLNPDPWKAPHPDGKSSLAGVVKLEVRAEGKEAVGTYEATWGAPWEVSGPVAGNMGPSGH